MKKLTSLCLALSALFLGSCNKDDGPGTDYTDQVKAVTGVYKGDLTVTLAGSPMPAQTQRIYVTANASGTAVKLEIRNFSFSGLTIGDIVLDEVPAVYENGQVVLQEKQTTLTIEGLGDLDVTLTEGAVSGNNFTMELSIYQSSADLQIGVAFDGDKTDDTDDGSEEIKAATGVYKGDLTVSLAGNPMPAQTQKIYVTANEAGTAVKLEIKNFSFSGLTIGDIVLDEVPAVYENGQVVLQEKQTTLTFEELGDVEVTLTEGAVSGENFTAELAIYHVAADLQIGVSFDGTKMAEDQSSEALLTGFTVTGSEAVVGEPVVDAEAKTVTIRVNTAEAVKITPEVTVSEGATVEPANGTEIDLSQPVEYVVTSQDGIVQNTYRVVVVTGSLATFDVWSKAESTTEWQQYPIPGDADWTSSNQALTLVKTLGKLDQDGNYSVMPADDAYSGQAAMVQTFDTQGMVAIGSFPAVPKVTAGSLFTGTFDMTTAMRDPLSGTLFGQPIDFQPKAVTGYYKYTPGATFYRCDDASQSNIAVEDASQTDQMSIKVVLYEVSDPSETLTGYTLNNDPSIIARGELISGETVSEYKPFTITLDYTGTYDASKSYKLAIVCSSSYLGDQFSGAPGSTLWIDEVEVQGM